MGEAASVDGHEAATLWPRAGGRRVEIGEKLGWGRDKVAKHSRLLKNVVPNALGIARSHQEGRGTDDVPVGTFTERWFSETPTPKKRSGRSWGGGGVR